MAMLAQHKLTNIPSSVGVHCVIIIIYTKNKMKLISVVQEPKGGKQFKATFKKPDGRTKTTRFGTASNYLLSKDKTEKDRQAYIARHSKVKGANYTDPTTAASLSMHILWSKTRSLNTAIRNYKKKYNV